MAIELTWTPIPISDREIPRDDRMSIDRLGILSATIRVMPLETSRAMPTNMVAWKRGIVLDTIGDDISLKIPNVKLNINNVCNLITLEI